MAHWVRVFTIIYPLHTVIFHSKLLVYQRVSAGYWPYSILVSSSRLMCPPAARQFQRFSALRDNYTAHRWCVQRFASCSTSLCQMVQFGPTQLPSSNKNPKSLLSFSPSYHHIPYAGEIIWNLIICGIHQFLSWGYGDPHTIIASSYEHEISTEELHWMAPFWPAAQPTAPFILGETDVFFFWIPRSVAKMSSLELLWCTESVVDELLVNHVRRSMKSEVNENYI